MFGVIFALSMVFLLGFAVAAPVGATVTQGETVTLGTQVAQSAVAWGGNITALVMSINTSTKHWAGFYGNVSAALRLSDDQNKSMKTWSATDLSGQIYAAYNNDSIDFTTLNDTIVSLTTFESTFNWLPGESDSMKNTSTSNYSTQFYIGSDIVYANTQPLIKTKNGSGDETWQEVVLVGESSADQKSYYVFTGIINNSGTSFNNKQADFQIIVPEDSSNGDTDAVNFYFYGELD